MHRFVFLDEKLTQSGCGTILDRVGGGAVRDVPPKTDGTRASAPLIVHREFVPAMVLVGSLHKFN